MARSWEACQPVASHRRAGWQADLTGSKFCGKKERRQTKTQKQPYKTRQKSLAAIWVCGEAPCMRVLRDNIRQTSSKLRHRSSGVAFHNQRLETRKGTNLLFDVFQRTVTTKIGMGEAFPKLDGSGLVHVEGLLNECLIRKHATEIDHTDIKEVVAVAKVAKVDEITLVANKDSIRKLKVAMDGGILVGNIGDESTQLLLLLSREKRVVSQQMVVSVFHVLELCSVNMRGVKLQAHLSEFFGILLHFFGMVACGTRIGGLVKNALETNPIAAILCDYILARFGGGDSHFIDLTREHHLIKRLLNLAWKIKFEHYRRVGLVVVAFAIGTAA